MTDERFDISRRKALAALGTIGVASAGAGLGTSAYFSDQETFENNQLVAGTLDLGVGYTAHYSDWSDDEGVGVGDVQMYSGGEPGETGSSGDLPTGYTGLPSNDAWLIAVPDGDVDTFLDNTQTGVYPDENPEDGVQDSIDCVNGGNSANVQADDAPKPVIALDDVKPGDFGEVTFDFILCDNPGYVWLNGELTSSSENGITEPEADDPQEEENEPRPASEDSESDEVELLDVVQAAVWVDDGDNYQDADDTTDPYIDDLRSILGMIQGSNGTELQSAMNAEQYGGTGEQGCFSPDTEHSIVFAWWVPIDHGNEIQSDSATFELGLYTEQCRHNDGSGMNNEDLGSETDDDAETPT